MEFDSKVAIYFTRILYFKKKLTQLSFNIPSCRHFPLPETIKKTLDCVQKITNACCHHVTGKQQPYTLTDSAVFQSAINKRRQKFNAHTQGYKQQRVLHAKVGLASSSHCCSRLCSQRMHELWTITVCTAGFICSSLSLHKFHIFYTLIFLSKDLWYCWIVVVYIYI